MPPPCETGEPSKTPFAIEISGWQLGGGVDFTFKPGTIIPSNSVLYVSPDVKAFRARTAGQMMVQITVEDRTMDIPITVLGETPRF